MTRYMIYFEPEELDADNIQAAEIIYLANAQHNHNLPKILKIIPAEFIFDVDQEKPHEVRKRT